MHACESVCTRMYACSCVCAMLACVCAMLACVCVWTDSYIRVWTPSYILCVCMQMREGLLCVCSVVCACLDVCVYMCVHEYVMCVLVLCVCACVQLRVCVCLHVSG